MARPRQSIVFAVAAAGVLLLATTPLQAQTTQRPERPYRGLFGGGAAAGAGHSLSLNASIGGGYDDNIRLSQPTGGGGNALTRPVAGTLATASASLGYSANLGRFSMGANAGSYTSYYPMQEQTLTGHGAGVGLSTPLARRTTLGFSSSVSYTPFMFASVIPVAEGLDVASFGREERVPLELATNEDQYFTYSSGLELGHSFSRTVTGSAFYSYLGRNATLYRTPFSRHGGGAGLQFELAQGLNLNLGYRRMQSDYYGGSNGDSTQESIDAGVNYSRALSFSRRTSVGFGTGSTIVRSSGTTRFRAIGNGTLNHEVGRTWLASATYTRGVRFVETLLEPVFQDSFTAGYGGLVNRRVSVQSSFSASVGTVGSGPDSGYDTYVAGISSTVAITTYMNFGVNYSIFRYSFEDGVVLPLGVPHSIDRQSVRATISVWAPLLTPRRANAAR